MELLEDGLIAFFSAVGVTSCVWLIAGALLGAGRCRNPAVRLVLPVYAPDAAACALACGKAHAELGAAFGLLQNFFRIEVEEVRIEPDFLDQRAEKFALSGQITARLLPLAIAGLRMVFRLADAKAE